jgi:hypothetical protein
MKNTIARITGFFGRWGLPLFLLLFALWVLYPFLAPKAALELAPATVRSLGWCAAVALALPYCHIAGRRFLRHRRALLGVPLLSQAFWLGVHLVFAYLAFLLTLFHSRGHGGTWLTWWILLLFWAVMLTGVIGYWGEKLIYRILIFTTEPEYGRGRLRTKERLRLKRRSHRLIEEYWKLTEYDVQDWRAFCCTLLDEKSLPYQVVYEPLNGSGLIVFDAIRAMRLAAQVEGSDLSPGQMNPIIGALNQFITWKRCDLGTDLKAPTEKEMKEAKGAKKAELDRRAQLASRAEDLRKTDERARSLLERANKLGLEDDRGLRNRLVLEAICPQILACEKPSEVLVTFYQESVEPYLEPERVSWRWLFTPAAREPIPNNVARHIRALVPPRQGRVVDQLLRWVERRRQLNVEAWLDRLATVWLSVHAVSAAALLVLVVDHILGSIRFGGF